MGGRAGHGNCEGFVEFDWKLLNLPFDIGKIPRRTHWSYLGGDYVSLATPSRVRNALREAKRYAEIMNHWVGMECSELNFS